MDIQFHFSTFDEYYVPALERIHILTHCKDDNEPDKYWIHITDDLFDKIQFSKEGLHWLCNIIWEDACRVSSAYYKSK